MVSTRKILIVSQRLKENFHTTVVPLYKLDYNNFAASRIFVFGTKILEVKCFKTKIALSMISMFLNISQTEVIAIFTSLYLERRQNKPNTRAQHDYPLKGLAVVYSCH